MPGFEPQPLSPSTNEVTKWAAFNITPPAKSKRKLFTSWEDISKVAVNAPALPGVIAEVGLSRSYPRGADTAHVVGYVGPVSDYDLERLEERLRQDVDHSIKGVMTVQVDTSTSLTREIRIALPLERLTAQILSLVSAATPWETRRVQRKKSVSA